MGQSRRFVAALLVAVTGWGAFVAWMTLEPLGERGSLIFDNLAELLAASIAAIACGLAARRAKGHQRAGWSFLAAGAGAWAAGQATWSYLELVANSDPFPSIADAGFLAAVPLTGAALLAFNAPARRGASSLRVSADALILGASVLFISWATFLGPIYRAGGGSLLERSVALAYPLGDLVLVTLVFSSRTVSRARCSAACAMIGAGIVAIAVSDALFAYSTVVGSGTFTLVGLGWIGGFSLFAVAAMTRQSVAAAEPAGAPLTIASAILPYAGVVIATAIGVTQVAAQGLDPFLAWNGIVLALLVLGRQTLTLTERISLEGELQRRAFHDPLTGLANRALFRDRIEQALRRKQRDGTDFALVFIDLDDFKTANDSLGHDAGDELLREVATRLRDCMRATDTPARLGGDEFALLLEGPAEPADVHAAAERAMAALRPAFNIAGREVFVGASIGMVRASTAGDSAETLLRSADVAMYAAKSHGKGRIEVFEPQMHVMVLRRADTQAGLHHAIERGELLQHYQPVVWLDTMEVAGVEALLRWDHPKRGLLLPRDFIAVAEETGQMISIGGWAIEQACSVAAAEGFGRPGRPEWISVNLTARQLSHPQIVAGVADALDRSRLAPSALMLEMTEDALMCDRTTTIARLRELSDLGVRLAIDHFGTGHSPLSYLQYLPVDHLKIDRAFVTMVGRGPKDRALIEMIRDLAATFGLTLIAEGVETSRQADELLSMGRMLGQGNHLGEPAPHPVPAAGARPLSA